MHYRTLKVPHEGSHRYWDYVKAKFHVQILLLDDQYHHFGEEFEKLYNNGCEGIPELFGQEVYGEDERGFFGKPKVGSLKTGGPGEMMQDPTMLAMAGLVVTVGATLLQMARGK